MLHATVAPLERDPAIEGLEIVEPRLRLDRASPAPVGDRGVPRPQVARDGQWYLGGPDETRPEACSQPSEKSSVGEVTHRIGARIRAGDEIQTNGREDARDRDQRRARGLTSLESPEMRMRYAGRGCHMAETQP